MFAPPLVNNQLSFVHSAQQSVERSQSPHRRQLRFGPDLCRATHHWYVSDALGYTRWLLSCVTRAVRAKRSLLPIFNKNTKTKLSSARAVGTVALSTTEQLHRGQRCSCAHCCVFAIFFPFFFLYKSTNRCCCLLCVSLHSHVGCCVQR